MRYLTQIDTTEPDQWKPVEASNWEAAAIKALRLAPKPAELLPCTVYVSVGKMRHEGGAPMVVQSFKIQRALKS